MSDVTAPGSPDIDINKLFESFGYTPTTAEAQALASSFGGANNASTKAAGVSAIAQYVNYRNQIKQFEASDPLTALQTRMNDLIDQNQKSVTGLGQQLQDTLSAAPELFGSLTPDQIGTYLAPLHTAFSQQLAQVQGIMASRGTAGSSEEANALAQSNQQFQETVLSTGLNIGLTSQQNKAKALQDQINNLFSQTGQALGISGNAASQQSSQKLGQSSLIGSLPSFLGAQAREQGAFDTQATKGSSFQDLFNQVTGDIQVGASALNTVGQLGSKAMGAFGGSPSASGASAAGGTNPMTPSFASTSPGGTNYQSPNLNLPGYHEFASTGSMFGS